MKGDRKAFNTVKKIDCFKETIFKTLRIFQTNIVIMDLETGKNCDRKIAWQIYCMLKIK